MKKWMIACVGLCLVAASGYFGYQYFFKKEEVSAAPVQTATVQRGDLAVKVSGSGTVSVVNSVNVKAEEAGTLLPLKVKEGDTVEKGQIIATYEAPDVESEVSKLESEYQKQKLQMEQLQKKFMEAGDEGGREDAAFEIEKLKLEMRNNRDSAADLEQQAKEVVGIAAPIAGKVTAVSVREGGGRVQEGADIVTITDYENLQTVIQVDELDIPKVKIGQTATIHLDALQDVEIQGKVSKIADEGSASNGVSLFDVTIAFQTQEGVRAGMTTSAELLVESKENVLLVPVEAVQERGGQTFVMLADASGSAPADPVERTEGAASPVRPNSGAGNGEQFARRSNASSGNEAERRERLQNWAAGREGQRPQGTAQSQGGTGMMRPVTVGSANEEFIEIVDGLKEGEKVILPAVASSSAQTRMPAGMGGFVTEFGGGGMRGNGVPPSGGERR
ncbi:Multidrug resistance protein MdtA [Paenibacillus sp. CECT 9249]|uniref:efflux RND transporter periplasmic adaptor subunit n=1 Tax=Paenibacillus sp. CECT 9249 TaxID=2845385 RepID=UPI001E2E5D9A|nr:efflux RND transporter periplasmic adaptor subunit [Paenibacillus sp. CECT 9249]CAH0121589.1 Multidrug resistance protein MdtA [Paenibacillus sp. CECT 9249]